MDTEKNESITLTESSRTGKVAVIADTTAAIPDDIIHRLGIRLVPYYVNIEGKTLRDVVDIGREQFYRWLPSAAKLPASMPKGHQLYEPIGS